MEKTINVFHLSRRFLAVILCMVLLVLLAGPYVAAQAPTITIYEPGDGVETQSPTITLRAVAAAPEGTSLAQIQVWANGAPALWKDKGVDPVLPGEVSVDAPLLPGQNQLVVVAIDDLGRRAERGAP